MKNNRKNRKLKFIRIKNSLRLGFNKFYCVEKTSSDLIIDSYILIETAKKSLLKEYNLSLPKINYTFGLCGDDFIKNLITHKVTLSLN